MELSPFVICNIQQRETERQQREDDLERFRLQQDLLIKLAEIQPASDANLSLHLADAIIAHDSHPSLSTDLLELT
jgi:hypothetical protein